MSEGGDKVPGMAEAIEARRMSRGLSPTDFAKAAGVTIQGLQPIRAGLRRKYQHKLKVGVARALHWPDSAIDDLLAGVDSATFPTVQPLSEEQTLAELLSRLDAEVRALRAEVNELRQRSAEAPKRPKSTRPNGQ